MFVYNCFYLRVIGDYGYIRKDNILFKMLKVFIKELLNFFIFIKDIEEYIVYYVVFVKIRVGMREIFFL